MQKVGHIKKLPVDLTALMNGLSSLLLPSQKPMFSQHMYAWGYSVISSFFLNKHGFVSSLVYLRSIKLVDLLG